MRSASKSSARNGHGSCDTCPGRSCPCCHGKGYCHGHISAFGDRNRNDEDAATVNLFVGHNRVHDWAYLLGYTEENSAMQRDNGAELFIVFLAGLVIVFTALAIYFTLAMRPVLLAALIAVVARRRARAAFRAQHLSHARAASLHALALRFQLRRSLPLLRNVTHDVSEDAATLVIASNAIFGDAIADRARCFTRRVELDACAGSSLTAPPSTPHDARPATLAPRRTQHLDAPGGRLAAARAAEAEAHELAEVTGNPGLVPPTGAHTLLTLAMSGREAEARVQQRTAELEAANAQLSAHRRQISAQRFISAMPPGWPGRAAAAAWSRFVSWIPTP